MPTRDSFDPKPPPRPLDPMIAARLAAREAFEHGFRRSDRGNLTRTWDSLRLTIFHRDFAYRWCISDGTETRFSPECYDDESVAIGALWEEVGW